ncbi:5-oxoprolinase subunit PxpA [Microlunatus aurantiacus]|uniref:5-oxoprolinase subunit PxpA n=1 Tax=Microlunatus aurantiacus TaxID=446786 RepID=A0ABP7CNZ0_9ACTN
MEVTALRCDNDAVPVDLNADLGESFGRWRLGDDEAMLTMITSANVACGFHAGDPAGLLRTCRSAVRRGVVIGAQVGYPDLVGFGRRFLDMAPEDLAPAVVYQIGALDALARTVGGRVAYVKPHGALYNALVDHEDQARAVVEAVASVDDRLPLLGLPGAAVLEIAERRGLRTITEYFIDRNYTPDGRLVDRRQPDAMITDAHLAAERAVRAARAGAADSLCLHGDSPDAVVMGRAVRAGLLEAGMDLAPFVGSLR